MRGYTLVELLIVLLLLGLTAAVTLPRLDRLVDSVRMAFEQDEVLDRLAALGYRARENGRGFSLSSYPGGGETDRLLELPQGWTLQAESPIVYHENGACLGGSVDLYYEGRALRVELNPPYCRPRI